MPKEMLGEVLDHIQELLTFEGIWIEVRASRNSDIDARTNPQMCTRTLTYIKS